MVRNEIRDDCRCGHRSRCGIKYTLFWACSIALWVALAVCAINSGVGGRVFTMHVGETWQIHQPPLWSRSGFGIHAVVDDRAGIEVYSFPPVLRNDIGMCPYTSGPRYSIKESKVIELSKGGDYEYDYYHLNQGSLISLNAQTQQGQANIYLLKGVHSLKTLQTSIGGKHDFRRESILKHFLGTSHTTLKYEVPESDFYVLAYQNNIFTPTKFAVQLDIDVSTHYLQNHYPICSYNTTKSKVGCFWKLDNDNDRTRVANSCIIAKAVATGKDNENVDGQQSVVVELESKIGSVYVFWIAMSPLVVGLLMWMMDCGKNTARSRMEERASLLRTPSNSYRATVVPTPSPHDVPLGNDIFIPTKVPV